MPGFMPSETMIEDGDVVVNTEKVYVSNGYYEVGCQWFVRNAPYGEETRMWVQEIIDGEVKGRTYKLPPFFKVIKKNERPPSNSLGWR